MKFIKIFLPKRDLEVHLLSYYFLNFISENIHKWYNHSHIVLLVNLFRTSEQQFVNLLYNARFMQFNTRSSLLLFIGFFCSFFMTWHVLQWTYKIFAQDLDPDPCYLPPNVNSFWLGPVPTYETFF